MPNFHTKVNTIYNHVGMLKYSTCNAKLSGGRLFCRPLE